MIFPIFQMVKWLLLFSWPPVCGVCTNYEVETFQPWKGTSPDLGSVTYCYVAMLLGTDPSFPPTTRCPPGGSVSSCPFPLSLSGRLVPTQDHFPTRVSPVFVPAYCGPSLPKLDSATSPPPPSSSHLPDSQHCALAATKISSNVVLSCF